jgi:hypothetical protein
MEEGFHAGLPDSWSPADEETSSWDWDLTESLTGLNRALRPKGCFGRLFGHHEWWTDADPTSITKYSYLDVNGFPRGWYENLDGSVERLQQKLEQAKTQQPLTIERLPMIAESVVQACEKWVTAVENKVIERQGLTAPDARKKVEECRTTLAVRQKRWHQVKAGDPEAANKALEELIDSASRIDREMERTPISNDPDEANAQLGKSAYSELVALLTPMQYACQKNDLAVIRKTWNEFDDKLNECASQLKASELSTALHWRLHGYESLKRRSRHGWIDPEAVAGEIEAIQWWQANVQKHMAELAYWRPLLVMDSDRGPYLWGDAGWAIVLADQRAVANVNLGRLAIAVDVS